MEIQILLLPWTSALAFLKALAWGGRHGKERLRATNFSFSEIKTSSNFRSVEVGKRCRPSSRAIQGQRVEGQRREGEQLHCRQSRRPCFRPGKGSFQRSGTSRLGPKEKEEIGKLRGRHVMFTTHEKCQPLRNLLYIYSFQNHIQFSQFCYFVTVASIA